MALINTAQKAARKIDEALGDYNLSDEEKAQILMIIEKSMIKSIEETASTHQEATVVCCGPEADLAHKIQEEAERKTQALIANLMALR